MSATGRFATIPVTRIIPPESCADPGGRPLQPTFADHDRRSGTLFGAWFLPVSRVHDVPKSPGGWPADESIVPRLDIRRRTPHALNVVLRNGPVAAETAAAAVPAPAWTALRAGRGSAEPRPAFLY